MTSYDRGDVVLVPFPFSDLTDVKRRPALVISTREYNDASGDVIIAQITGRTSARPLPGDHRVQNWKKAGLLAPSLVRVRVTTLRANLVVRALGQMPTGDMQLIDKQISSALGL